MIKSQNMVIALAVIVLATVTLFKSNIDSKEDSLLRNYSEGARQWSTVNYYSVNQGGYQISAAEQISKAFH